MTFRPWSSAIATEAWLSEKSVVQAGSVEALWVQSMSFQVLGAGAGSGAGAGAGAASIEESAGAEQRAGHPLSAGSGLPW